MQAMISVGVNAPGKTTTLCVTAKLHNLNIEARTGQKPSASVQAAARRFNVDDGTGANDQFGFVARELGNHLDSSRSRHRHFRDWNPAV